MTVLASSVKASADKQIDRTLAADYAFTAKDFNVFSTDVGERLKKTPGVAAATSVRGGEWRYGDAHKFLMAADPDQVDHLIRIGVEKGDARSIGRGEVLVWDKEAKRKKLTVGSTLAMTFARGREPLTRGRELVSEFDDAVEIALVGNTRTQSVGEPFCEGGQVDRHQISFPSKEAATITQPVQGRAPYWP